MYKNVRNIHRNVKNINLSYLKIFYVLNLTLIQSNH